MLTKYIIEGIIFLIGQVLSIISSVFPGFTELETLTQAVNMLLGVTTQVQNFAYFLFGDFYYLIFALASVFLPFKFIVTPILIFIRKLFVWGGN